MKPQDVTVAAVRPLLTAFTSLDHDQRSAAKNLLLRLVELGDGTEDTKRRVARAELDP